jgi:hypothetical protein
MEQRIALNRRLGRTVEQQRQQNAVQQSLQQLPSIPNFFRN